MGVERSAECRPRFNGFNTMQGGHFRLVTLGHLALERSDGHVDERLASLNSRRRKVALLAVLSLARRGVSRDTLVEMFWGDQDETRARHSLSDAISHLRRVLGRESIVATRSDIAIASAAPLVVDAVELASSAVGLRAVGESEDAILASTERTVALYTGPFLGGMYLDGSATFEHWVSCERARLERLFVRAAEVRCKALAIAGRFGECQALAERWLDADPLSAEAAVSYLKSLSDAGESDGRVLAAFERLRARLDREYEMEPDPEVATIAARIAERRRERVAVAVRAEIARGAAGGPPPTTESDANPPAIHHSSNPTNINLPLNTRAPRRHIALGLITVILVAAAVVAGANRSVAITPRTSATTVVAVADIGQTGSDTSLAGHHALLADSVAEHADVRTLSSLADSIERVGVRSDYASDRRLRNRMRGLIAACSGDLELAERELHDAKRESAGDWSRTVLELVKVQLACSRPLDAVVTLRDAYSAHPDAMGRYLPRTEIDFWMAVAFRRAGQMDSASVYSAYVRRAWATADPEARPILTRIDR